MRHSSWLTGSRNRAKVVALCFVVAYVADDSNTAVFEPVAAPSTYEHTLVRLGTAIRIGILPPHTRLPPERELAEQLGISRSTLRQALATLTETGHLVAVRGRTGGTFVAASPPVASGLPVSPERTRALLDWRMALELGTVQLAAERATDDQRATLQEMAGHCAKQEAWPEFRRRDARFHLCLAEAAGSGDVVKAMTRVQGELSDVLTHLDRSEFAAADSAAQHRQVASAVAHRDVAGAQKAMRAHLTQTETCFGSLLSG
jgi:GntR family transcriptional regulator, transcriptional repressor for pyruvate dehydrogenase complex